MKFQQYENLFPTLTINEPSGHFIMIEDAATKAQDEAFPDPCRQDRPKDFPPTLRYFIQTFPSLNLI